jgi:hypothetical protein
VHLREYHICQIKIFEHIGYWVEKVEIQVDIGKSRKSQEGKKNDKNTIIENLSHKDSAVGNEYLILVFLVTKSPMYFCNDMLMIRIPTSKKGTKLFRNQLREANS